MRGMRKNQDASHNYALRHAPSKSTVVSMCTFRIAVSESVSHAAFAAFAKRQFGPELYHPCGMGLREYPSEKLAEVPQAA